MKIIVPTTKIKDIGPLDTAMRVSAVARHRIGMSTTCDRCGKQVAEAWFICGFKTGWRNMIFHESCWDGTGERIGPGWARKEASDEQA